MSAFALTREEILGALADMNRRLEGQGIIGEICLFGGALMVLAFNARLSTKDVDALFQPSTEVRHAAAQVAAERGWPEAWLNDGVKGFISARHEITAGQLPQFSNLRLTMPTPEYLLAMKCVAADKLEALRRIGVTYVILNCGGSREALQRFAREIMPAFL